MIAGVQWKCRYNYNSPLHVTLDHPGDASPPTFLPPPPATITQNSAPVWPDAGNQEN